MQVGEWITAECIDTRMGSTKTQGGIKPVFIVELACDLFAMPIIKYFSCQHKGKNYTVPHNGDFAKTWRLTKGTNPKNQYSKAQQLLNQLPGHKFLVKGAPTSGKTTYFKATEIKPLKPVYSELWTPSGVLKKCPKKVTFQPPEIGSELATDWQNVGNNLAESWQKVGNEETLQTAKTLGLEPVFNPTSSGLPGKRNHLPTKPLLEAMLQEPRFYNYPRQENESDDDYHQRVIDQSWEKMDW